MSIDIQILIGHIFDFCRLTNLFVQVCFLKLLFNYSNLPKGRRVRFICGTDNQKICNWNNDNYYVELLLPWEESRVWLCLLVTEGFADDFSTGLLLLGSTKVLLLLVWAGSGCLVEVVLLSSIWVTTWTTSSTNKSLPEATCNLYIQSSMVRRYRY